MQFTKKTDYSIMILRYLRDTEEERRFSSRFLADELDVSYEFLRKIIQELEQLGYLEITLGRSGGVKLTERAYDLPISNLIAKMELPNDDYYHMLSCDKCKVKTNCKFPAVTRLALNSLVSSFEQITINDL